ncbi:MAG: enoyl-[acyl-carrier protein] reductase [Thermoplasmata archaeon]|jgi:enoyl-[acyl-carrier protein] reductase I|nr:enoyl-[acyl-carrier protein] reductase [Thermoplasmata archaeon]
MSSFSLAGKRALVFGVASEDSIAWAIAQELAAHGAKVTMGYQKRFLSRIMGLFKDKPWIEGSFECDAAVEESVAKFFTEAKGPFDMMVHCIAFAPATALQDEVVKTTEADWNVALGVSAYSLVRLTRHATPHMGRDGAIVSLTYLGADRFVPGYRVMSAAKAALQELTRELSFTCGREKGIRVNAISAGPIRTLAASGIPGFTNILDWMRHSAPLGRNVTQQDVAKAALFLLSDLGSGVTGQTLYVDAGYSIVGVPPDLDRMTLPGQAGQAPPPAPPSTPNVPSAPKAQPLIFGKKP